MKKGLVLAVFLILVLTAGAFAFQNEPEGFRGLKWGDSPTEDMQQVGQLEGAYFRLTDKMFLGDVELYLIGYRFYQQRFMSVALYFNGEDNYDLLEMICKERYGTSALTRGFYKLKWIGQASFVMLQYDFADEKGFLAISSTPLAFEQLEAQNKQQAEKAKGDW